MGKVVDLQAGRSRHGYKQADERAARLKEALRSARDTPPTREESTSRLLALFKRKPAPRQP